MSACLSTGRQHSDGANSCALGPPQERRGLGSDNLSQGPFLRRRHCVHSHNACHRHLTMETVRKGTLIRTLETSLLTSQCALAFPLPSVDFFKCAHDSNTEKRFISYTCLLTLFQVWPKIISFSSVLTFPLCVLCVLGAVLFFFLNRALRHPRRLHCVARMQRLVLVLLFLFLPVRRCSHVCFEIRSDISIY